MLSSRKPLTLALSTAALTSLAAIPVAAPFGPSPLGTGEKGKAYDKADYEFTEADAAKVEELFAQVVSSGEAGSCQKADAAYAGEEKDAKSECSQAAAASKHEESWETLSKVLTWKPEAWEVVKPLAFAKFEGEATQAERENVLSLLAWQYSLPAVTIASEIAEAHPDTEFTEDQLIAFAEAGSERFWKRAAMRSKHSVKPAALLVLHGEKYGVDVLEKAVAQPFDPERATETWVAALALKKLGKPEAFEATRANLHEAALTALDEGNLERAGQLALTGEFLHEAVSPYGQTRLSFLDVRCSAHCRERAAELQSADDVFALVEHLSAL